MGIHFGAVKNILQKSSKSRVHDELHVPKGHVVVYVGTEEDHKKRFVVPISYLRQPSFVDLLNQAEQ